MYTLRKISKQSKYQMNICLGNSYTLTTMESEAEFKQCAEMTGLENDDYIMTESGLTFDNLNKYY